MSPIEFESVRKKSAAWLAKLAQIEVCYVNPANDKSTADYWDVKCPTEERKNELWLEIAYKAQHSRAALNEAFRHDEYGDRNSPNFLKWMEIADNYGSLRAHEIIATDINRQHPMYDFYGRKWAVTNKKYKANEIFKGNCKDEFGNGFKFASWHDLESFFRSGRQHAEIMARDAGFYHLPAAVSYQRRLTPNNSTSYAVSIAFELDYKKANNANRIYNQPLAINEYKRPIRQLCVSL